MAYLVTLSDSSNDILGWDFEVIEIQSASRRCTNAQFLFFLCNLYAHVLCGGKTSNTLITLTGVNLGLGGENERSVPTT